jgi:hypothetical protein
MTRVESSIQVRKSVAEIFAFLNERESHLKFIPRIIELDQLSAGEFGQVGTTAKGMLRYFGVRIPVDYEIIEHQPDQRLAMKGQMGPVNFKDGYILSKNGKGTDLKFWLELAPMGWAKLFSPFMGWIGKIHAYETLRNLRRELTKEEIASSPLHDSSQ